LFMNLILQFAQCMTSFCACKDLLLKWPNEFRDKSYSFLQALI